MLQQIGNVREIRPSQPDHGLMQLENCTNELIDLGDRIRSLLLGWQQGDELCEDEIPSVERRIAILDEKITRLGIQLVKGGKVEEIPCICIIRWAREKIRIDHSGKIIEKTIMIVDDGKRDISRGLISSKTLLAKCLCGAKLGETYWYPPRIDTNDVCSVTVLGIEPPVYIRKALALRRA